LVDWLFLLFAVVLICSDLSPVSLFFFLFFPFQGTGTTRGTNENDVGKQ